MREVARMTERQTAMLQYDERVMREVRTVNVDEPGLWETERRLTARARIIVEPDPLAECERYAVALDCEPAWSSAIGFYAPHAGVGSALRRIIAEETRPTFRIEVTHG
jgi:hypothetical protein